MTVLQDSPISFPGLFGDWQFTASSVALHVGHNIYWYGIILGLGVLAGLVLCSKQAHRYGLKEDHVLDLVLWGVPIGILGARTYYVIFYQSLFRDANGALDWKRVVSIWDGGMAIYGTVIAVFILAFVYCRIKKIRMGALTDLCVMGLLIGQAVGRWGNFMNREAFGAETTLPWRMRLMTGVSSYIEVHPTFFYESLWNVIGLCLLLFVISKTRPFDGESTWFYFLWYGLGRTWIEGLRTDSLYLFDWTLMGEPIRVSQALSLVMVVVSAGVLFYEIKIKKRTSDGLMVNQMARAASEAAAPAAADAQMKVESAEAIPEAAESTDAENKGGDSNGDAH